MSHNLHIHARKASMMCVGEVPWHRLGQKMDHPASAEEAIEAAKEMLTNQGGGEIVVKGLDGKIRSKDTIAPGNDPNPPNDKEH